jgi:hypothetical protein
LPALFFLELMFVAPKWLHNCDIPLGDRHEEFDG